MPGDSTDEADGFRRIAMLIPARDPDAKLMELVGSLQATGFGSIVVVDDGSRPASHDIFEPLRRSGVKVRRHAANLGKGRALKTGFHFLLAQNSGTSAVITADADGQHTLADIVRVARALLRDGERPVLGVRSLAGKVPMRNKLGNLLTRMLFSFITGARWSDTQCGLRGFPVSLLPELIALEGERYEYEMTVLAHLCRSGRRPAEVPIATVYLDGNRGSHFHPLWDSIRIYSALARFYLSSP